MNTSLHQLDQGPSIDVKPTDDTAQVSCISEIHFQLQSLSLNFERDPRSQVSRTTGDRVIRWFGHKL